MYPSGSPRLWTFADWIRMRLALSLVLGPVLGTGALRSPDPDHAKIDAIFTAQKRSRQSELPAQQRRLCSPELVSSWSYSIKCGPAEAATGSRGDA